MFFIRKYINLIRKNGKTPKDAEIQAKENDRYINVNDSYFKVKNHWFIDQYEKTSWEPQTYKTYTEFLDKDTVYIDIGTWIGITIFYAAEIGVKRIYGIEANLNSYIMCKSNLEMNKLTKNAILDHICVTDKDNEEVNFGSPQSDGATSSASSLRGHDWKVKTATINSYLKNIIY